MNVELPHRRMEDWRWTDLRRLIGDAYPAAIAATSDANALARATPFAKVAKARLVFVNGQYDRKLSKTDGLRIDDTVPPPLATEPVQQLNAAAAAGGVTLTLSGNVDAPVELLYLTTAGVPRATACRNAIRIEDGAAATLIETHLGEGDYLANAVTEIRLGAGARLDRVKVELESAAAVHLSHVQVSLGANSVLRDFTLTSGARLNRQNGTYGFDGEYADAKINGSYLLKRKQHADTRLVVDHRVPHCTSRELFKCVMDGDARGIFQGKVIVRPGAQKTDGKQSSHALLLSETAEFDAKPELEIYADDVVCGHGATSGDLNHDHLFYLKSRGIPEAEARALLVAAFVDEAFDAIGNEAVKAVLVKLVESKL
jgi:Fe-S cluster assembly protein SufD